MTCSIHQPPSPTMRRRLARSVESGWLLRLHGSDCSHLTGAVVWLDRGMQRCLFEAPGTLHPERDVLLDEICDVEVLSVAMVREGRLAARLAVVAPWRGGSDDDDVLIADLMSGQVAVGQTGIMLLLDGVRRYGTITEMHGQRCRVALLAA